MGKYEFLKEYSLAEGVMRKIYDSQLRLSILLALKQGPLRLADLRREVDSNAPNTSAKAKELEEMGLIERVEGDFQLSPWGRAVQERAEDSFRFYACYEKFKGFWETHHMEGIPTRFLIRLGELYDSELVACSKENPIKTHELLVDYLATVKKDLRVVSPILQDEWVRGLAMLGKNGVNMQFVFTELVLMQFAKTASEELEIFEKKAKFFQVPENHSIAGFVASDSFFCFSIESKAVPNNYMDMKLYSKSKEAIAWGYDYFEHDKSIAREVKLADFV